jgi:hypothetical protein
VVTDAHIRTGGSIPLSITVVDGADQIINANRMPDILVRVTAAGSGSDFQIACGIGCLISWRRNADDTHQRLAGLCTIRANVWNG